MVESTADYTHKFLITMPMLDGDYFEKSVIYICTHDEQGTLGLVINRPANYTVGKLFEQMGIKGSKRLGAERLIEGGPVALEVPMVLHTADWQTEDTWILPDDLGLTFASQDGESFYQAIHAIAKGEGPERFLLALGHAGWRGGQLDDEMSKNAWVTCPYDRKILFDLPFEKKYQQACNNLGFDMYLMSRQGGEA